MKKEEEKAKQITDLLTKHTREALAQMIETKSGAKISGSTITRAANNKDISPNTLCLIHYVLTH